MQRHEYSAGFPVGLALKDLKLVREVASSSDVEMPVLDAILKRVGDAQRSTPTTTSPPYALNL
jgi:3-hydroxyisobutyrate dehydrogenase-like beta-hydroxyacid dehydrogenase